MRRAAPLLCLAAACLLLMPWQICDCSDDGPHLKLLWDHSGCPHDDGPWDGDPPEDDCDELYFVTGAPAEGGAAITAPAPSVDVALVVQPRGADVETQREAHRIHDPGRVPPGASPVSLATRLLV